MVEVKETVKTKKNHKRKIMALMLFVLFILNFMVGFFLGQYFNSEVVYKEPDIIIPIDINNDLKSKKGLVEGSDNSYNFSYFELNDDYYLTIQKNDIFISTIKVNVDNDNLSIVKEQLHFATISHFATVAYIDYIRQNHDQGFDTQNNPISISTDDDLIIAETDDYPVLMFDQKIEISDDKRETIILIPNS